MMMCDDLGYGDTGFNGNTIIKTPSLDAMAKSGVIMTHFYAAGPVCSPTRATCLTGRHYNRMGVWSANKGHLPRQEIIISEILKEKGYATGHFGKWHLGTLSKTLSSKGANRNPSLHFSPPWEHSYDESFVAESAVATWNPGTGRRAKNNPYYYNGKITTDNLEGGAGRVVMDRAIPFIEKAAKENKPFFAVIWFNAPHEDIVAGPEYLKMYKGYGEAAHYYGCITEMDEQVGRLQQTLKKLGVYENTLQFFTSDNGPEGSPPKKGTRRAGSAGPFSGRKRDIYDGGVRVPTLTVWPGKITPDTRIDVPAITMDYFPTIAKVVGVPLPSRPYDGIDMMPILTGSTQKRTTPIPFAYGTLGALVDGKYKLITNGTSGETDVLYDLSRDVREENNIISQHPEKAIEMKKKIIAFFNSAAKSAAGKDYPGEGEPNHCKIITLPGRSKGPILPKNNQKSVKSRNKKKPEKK